MGLLERENPLALWVGCLEEALQGITCPLLYPSPSRPADLSRNRFAEVPEAVCHLMSLERLTLYHNCLRSIPPAIANLQALTYLNLR